MNRFSLLMTSTASKESPYARAAKALRLTAVPFVIGVATVFLLMSTQARDCVQVLLEDWDLNLTSKARIATCLFDFGLLVACLGFVSHWILQTAVPKRQPEDSADWSDVFMRALPFVWAAVPVGGWIARLLRQFNGMQDPDVGRHIWILLGASVVVACIAYLVFLPPVPEGEPKGWIHAGKRTIYRAVGWVYLVSILAMVGGGALLALFPFHYGAFWGPLANLFTGLAAYALILGGLAQFSERKRFPWLYALILPVAALQYFNLQTFREVTLYPAPNRAADKDPANPLRRQFSQWLKSRPGPMVDGLWVEPYPVVIVAAQGGGIRAAALTALALASLDEQCPGFSDHVFVISGVSGGSVGAGFYAAMLGTGGYPFDRTKRLEEVLRVDFLSAPLGRLFFTDLPLSWLPFWRLQCIDRSDALSQSFRQGWSAVVGGDALGLHMSAFDLKAPYLALNSTSIAHPSPFVLTRLEVTRPGSQLSGLSRLSKWKQEFETTLADAMALSARFPVFSSIGVVRGLGDDSDSTDELVDGGYFDNSGLTTALSVLRQLLEAGPFRCRFMILRIGSDDTAPANKGRRKNTTEWEDPMPPFASALSIVDAAMHVYMEGNGTSKDEALLKIAGMESQSISSKRWPSAPEVAWEDIVLPPPAKGDDNLPLGWMLSSRSIQRIEEAIGAVHPMHLGGYGGDVLPRNLGAKTAIVHWLRQSPLPSLHRGNRRGSRPPATSRSRPRSPEPGHPAPGRGRPL